MEDKSHFIISPEIKAKLNNKIIVKEALEEGVLIQDLMEFSGETMNKFYKAATSLITQKRYGDAANAFLFLVVLNPYHYDYWLGLGLAAQNCGEYEGAINAYEMAAICEIENPIPYFYLAKCLFAMHDRINALQAIDMAIEYAGEQQDNEELYEKALAAKELILKEG